MTDPDAAPIHFVKGRGAGSNGRSRFEGWQRVPNLDYLETERGEFDPEVEPQPIATEVTVSEARSIISYNTSPDIPFSQSINPYSGCEHGCIYCYARPTHAYLGLSPGLDFETKLVAKGNAAELLRQELSRKSYDPSHIALGANTDPYQPIERGFGITRSVLEVLSEFRVPVSITTKSALVVRDIDLLAPMAAMGIARVNISLATLDSRLARIMDPRANSPQRRLRAIEELSLAGIPVSVFASPMIPALNDVDLEAILEAAAAVGAKHASMIVLRLPLEVRDLFVDWLHQHFPLRAEHVMSLVRQMRNGADYDSNFGARMRGSGAYAALLRQRFQIARRRFGLAEDPAPLSTSLFRRQVTPARQHDLFD